MAWFRFYAEALHDPKLQNLPDRSFKAWVNALCLACQLNSATGSIGKLGDIAFAFHETEDAVSSAFHPLVTLGMLTRDGETFHIAKWQKRQYKSDTSTNRVKRFRKRKRNVTETVPDTDTDQIQIRSENPPVSPSQKSTQKKVNGLPHVFGHDEVKTAKRGDPAYDPELHESEILPGGWYDLAEKHGIKDDKIYKIWAKFKDTTPAPYPLNRWKGWINREFSN